MPAETIYFKFPPKNFLEKLGIVSERRDSQLEALKKIEETGMVNVLVRNAVALRSKGDKSAIVVESSYGSHVMVQLLWDLEKNKFATASSWWSSKGVALEATKVTKPKVRFTDGMSWNYLDYYAETIAVPDRYVKPVNLEPDERELLKVIRRENSVGFEAQIQVAMKVAEMQSDFRYGEGDISKFERPSRHLRHIYPAIYRGFLFKRINLNPTT